MRDIRRRHKVTIRATARLHLGFIDLHGGLGRLYGSLGVSLMEPQCVIEIQETNRGIKVAGDDTSRIKTLAKKYIKHLGFDGGLQFTQWEAIPEHVGLGSGTQMALSIGAGIAKLLGKKLSVYDYAEVVGRGVVSGVGTATFAHGGFVIDGGLAKPDQEDINEESVRPVPPLTIRHTVPLDWIFVVAIPNISAGLSGEREERAFRKLPPGEPKQAQIISRLILMKLLPALIEDDIERFGQALTRIQILVGDSFASAQGGRFANPEITKCVDAMLDAGAVGGGQSSWGPACYGLVRGEEMASDVMEEVQVVLDSGVGGKTFATPVNNQGANITME